MSITIALAGNPNSGKTTLFNALTGTNQYVGNWPGVTVEKKEGRLKTKKDIIIMDLPGIYSLSPYTLEEVVTRNYLVDERPNVILNIIDGTNLERNLYLTTQLTELGIPVVVAVNMMDIIKKNGDKIDIEKLSASLGCTVVEISALRGTGVMEAAETAIKKSGMPASSPMHSFSGLVEHTIAHIEEAVLHDLPDAYQRWFAIKLFERDEKIIEKLGISEARLAHIDEDIKKCEDELDDDCDSIITSERYGYIDSIIKDCYKTNRRGKATASDKIDRIVTNRILALPIFAAIMFIVYFISVSTVGGVLTDWANDGVFGDGWHLLGIGSGAYEEAVEHYNLSAIAVEDEPDPADYGVWVHGIPVLVGDLLERVNCADWLQGLILDGIIGGVGAVLGFVPQILVLFIFLGFLEGCGYMARIAFIMDRIFRRFGLSGKSFIPILIGTGCGIPGIMASRTIENDKDRKMTIMTTTFIPCGAKLPIIAMISTAVFGGAWWMAPVAYFIGIAAIITSGIILKKTKMFAGDAAPFVMELPSYHMPTVGNVLRNMWERGWSFIKRAGTVVLLATIVIWFLMSFGFQPVQAADGSETNKTEFAMVDEFHDSFLDRGGNTIKWIFAPLGWGNSQATVATVTGLVAKEVVVGTLGVLNGIEEADEENEDLLNAMPGIFPTALAAFSFLVFNLLCAPCFAAIGAIRREMNNAKWTWFTIGYQCGFAYVVSLCIYHIGSIFTGQFGVGAVIAILLAVGFLYLLFRKAPVAVKAAAQTHKL